MPPQEDRWIHTFLGPLRLQYADKVMEPRVDFGALGRFYDQELGLEAQRAELYLALGASGHPQALATLWKEALAAADLEAEAERDNLPGKLASNSDGLRQGPSIRIHGLARRRKYLFQAFAAAPGAAAFLGSPDTGKEAAEKDAAAKSAARRVFLADALAALPAGAGRARLVDLLPDPAPEVRIAALEGLAAGGSGLPAPLAARLLEDQVPAVRFAALDLLLENTPKDPRWIEPVGQAYLGAKGRLRADALRLLQAASGRVAGDDPAGWKAWLEETRAAREAGTWKPAPPPPAAPGGPGAPGPAPRPPAALWGIPVESDRVIVAADGWSTLQVPADHALQATRHVADWVTGPRGWKKEKESLQDVLARQVRSFAGALPPEASFRVLLVGSPTNRAGDMTWFDERGFVAANPRNAARAHDFVAGFHPGREECFQLGLQEILATRDADTCVLVTSGFVKADRFAVPDVLVEEFRRRNRFRRLRVHVVHVMDHGPDVERMLRDLAKAAGGTLQRALVAPPL